MNDTVTLGKNLFSDARHHSVGYVIFAAILLGCASLSLLVSSIWPSGTAMMMGQILFVGFVFAAVTLLVITAIAQDIRKPRRNDGVRRNDGIRTP